MMKKDKLKKIAAFAVAAALTGVMAFSLTACNDDKGGTGGGTGTEQGAILLDKSTATVKAGDTTTIKVNSSHTEVITWTSSDPTVATVQANGNTGKLCTVTGVAEGTAIIKAKAGSYEATCTVTVEAAEQGGGEEDKGTPIAIGFGVSTDPGWTYWHGIKYADAVNGWGNVSEAHYYAKDNSASITFSNGSADVPHTVQLNYNNPEYTGVSHDISLTVVSPVAGNVMINAKPVALKEGENKVTVEGYSGEAFHIQFGVAKGDGITGDNLTFEFKDIVLTSNVTTTLEAPEFSIASDTKVITITDTNNDATKVEKYELGFFESGATEPVKTLVVTNGSTVDLSSIPGGTYTVKIKAMNPTDGTVRDSEWSTASQTLTVTNANTIIDDTTTSGWYYWKECGVGNVYLDSDGVIHVESLGSQSNSYSFQLKKDLTKKITGIKMTVHAAQGGYIAFGPASGSVKEVEVATDTDVEVNLTGLNIEGTLVICFANNVSRWADPPADLAALGGNITLSNIVITYAD